MTCCDVLSGDTRFGVPLDYRDMQSLSQYRRLLNLPPAALRSNNLHQQGGGGWGGGFAGGPALHAHQPPPKPKRNKKADGEDETDSTDSKSGGGGSGGSGGAKQPDVLVLAPGLRESEARTRRKGFALVVLKYLRKCNALCRFCASCNQPV